MAGARKLLELIRDKHAHRQQANKNNSNISRSRRANNGGGNQISHKGGKPNAKSKDGNNKKHQSHSKVWTVSIQPNNKWVEGQEHCPDEIFQRLHGWEKQKLRRASRAYEGATTKAQLKDQSEMIATLTAQNKDLKRKVGAVGIRLGHTEKAQRSSTNNNYKSIFVADDAGEDKVECLAVIVILIVVK